MCCDNVWRNVWNDTSRCDGEEVWGFKRSTFWYYEFSEPGSQYIRIDLAEDFEDKAFPLLQGCTLQCHDVLPGRRRLDTLACKYVFSVTLGVREICLESPSIQVLDQNLEAVLFLNLASVAHFHREKSDINLFLVVLLKAEEERSISAASPFQLTKVAASIGVLRLINRPTRVMGSL